MSFTENLKVEIESLLDAKGFKQLEKNVTKAKAEMQSVNQAFNQADGLRNFRKNVQQEAGKVRQEANQMGRVLKEAGLEEAPESLNAPFLDPRQGNNLFSQQVGIDEAKKRIIDAQDRIREGRMGAGSIFGGEVRMTGGGAPNMALQEAKQMDTPNVRKFGILRRVLFRVASTSRLASSNMNRMAYATSRASAGFTALAARAMSATGAIRAQIPQLQTLQMQLLGVQFSLLSLAFIFGGLMMSALSAVGVFEILGNTLKMFFLPTALELLPAVLDIRDAILGIDDDTKKSIGRIFLIIAAIGALGSILAFTASGVLGFIKGVKMLLSPLGFLIKYLAGTETVMGAISQAASWLTSVFGGVMGAIGGVLSFLAGFVAGFKIVDELFKHLNDVLAASIGMILGGLALLAAGFIGFASAPFIVAGLVGAAVGAIVAVIWNMREQIWNILKDIAGFFFDIFKGIFNFLVGNSIIPDMVNDIVDWLFKLPKMIAGLGSSIVETIVNGIKSMGGAIWSAFKKIMPDFLVDAIEGAGKAVSNAVGTVGDFAGGAVDAAGNFVNGVGDTVSGLNPFAGNNNGGNTTVQNNNVNANVEVNDKEETPQETGRQFGRGFAQSMNSRQSNIANGT